MPLAASSAAAHSERLHVHRSCIGQLVGRRFGSPRRRISHGAAAHRGSRQQQLQQVHLRARPQLVSWWTLGRCAVLQLIPWERSTQTCSNASNWLCPSARRPLYHAWLLINIGCRTYWLLQRVAGFDVACCKGVTGVVSDAWLCSARIFRSLLLCFSALFVPSC